MNASDKVAQRARAYARASLVRDKATRKFGCHQLASLEVHLDLLIKLRRDGELASDESRAIAGVSAECRRLRQELGLSVFRDDDDF